MAKEFRYITRMAETDLEGSLKVAHAISKIRGIGLCLANSIVEKSGVNPETRLGFLAQTDLEKLEDIIRNPAKYDLPGWLLNCQKDLSTGKNLHLTGADLVLQTKTAIDRMKATKSWKGYRHSFGLKVRGQRTKTTGRKGKAVGVKKKTLRSGAKG